MSQVSVLRSDIGAIALDLDYTLCKGEFTGLREGMNDDLIDAIVTGFPGVPVFIVTRNSAADMASIVDACSAWPKFKGQIKQVYNVTDDTTKLRYLDKILKYIRADKAILFIDDTESEITNCIRIIGRSSAHDEAAAAAAAAPQRHYFIHFSFTDRDTICRNLSQSGEAVNTYSGYDDAPPAPRGPGRPKKKQRPPHVKIRYGGGGGGGGGGLFGLRLRV